MKKILEENFEGMRILKERITFDFNGHLIDVDYVEELIQCVHIDQKYLQSSGNFLSNGDSIWWLKLKLKELSEEK
jgi:hypothetical protein